MRKSIIALTTAALCVAAGLSFLTAPAMAKEVVKIAFVGPLTGGNSSIGLGGRNSADLAVRLRNADPKTKYTYQLVTQDDECPPNVGVQVATKVAADNGIVARVYEISPRLEERSTQLAGTMSGGEQAMVSIGRGLMAAPKLLVIDEPSLGLSPLYVKENFNVIRQINALGITVLLVEQNARQTLAISHYGYVLSQGRVVAQGTAESLAANDEVRSAYFG
jgi:ABC-type molybdate transport system ATPase subunit